MKKRSRDCRERLLHNSLNRNRFKDKIMQKLKVLQRPLRVLKDAPRCSAISETEDHIQDRAMLDDIVGQGVVAIVHAEAR